MRIIYATSHISLKKDSHKSPFNSYLILNNDLISVIFMESDMDTFLFFHLPAVLGEVKGIALIIIRQIPIVGMLRQIILITKEWRQSRYLYNTLVPIHKI